MKQSNPYEAGHAETPATHCIIRDASKLRVPRRCVVCDSPDAELHSYVQDHIPMVTPFFTVYRRTQSVLPYCAAHAAAFERRFRILRYAQWTMISLFFGGMAAALLSERRRGAGGVLSTLLLVLSMSALFLLPVTVIVRRFLYDAFFKYRRDGLKISSRYAIFIERLRAANGLLPRTSAPLPAEMFRSLPADDPMVQERFIETRSGSDQYTSRGAVLPAVVISAITFVGLFTAFMLADMGLFQIGSVVVVLVLNSLGGVLVWWVLRAASRGNLAGWDFGHWVVFVAVAYALGVCLALYQQRRPHPGRLAQHHRISSTPSHK